MVHDVPMGEVRAVCRAAGHDFSKPVVDRITLREGLGVEDDAHAGATVQHLSRVRRDPAQPNLRQVHLVHSELFHELAGRGHHVRAGQMGENITTTGIDLLSLPEGTRLRLGASAVVRVTGLRNPCYQLNGLSAGLMQELVHTDSSGEVVRRAGVMGVVERGGEVKAGDAIAVELPGGQHRRLLTV
jgi:MOSC domain-containing protein YiiM